MDKDKIKRNSNAKKKQQNNSLNDKYNIKTFLKKRQLKTLSNNNVSNKINKAKKENTLTDINHLLNHRYSCIIQGNKNIIINNSKKNKESNKKEDIEVTLLPYYGYNEEEDKEINYYNIRYYIDNKKRLESILFSCF